MGRQRRRVDRAAGAGSGTLPEAIAALSRALPCGPSPETFRRAKFDRPEAAPALWQLLFRVLSPVSEAGATAPPAPEAQARLVKAALRSEGYPRPALAQLPEDGSRGSRELLLALSWLLARRPLLERLLARTRVRLGDEVAVCECEDLAFGRANTGLPALGLGSELHVDIRHVQWLMGKLRFQWRNLVSTQQEQCALLSKVALEDGTWGRCCCLPLPPAQPGSTLFQIHLYTWGCHSDQSLGHLSATETEVLRDPEGSQQLLQVLEQENAHLAATVEWRRRELVFWQWMDTVLDTCPQQAPDAGSQPVFLPKIPDHRAGQWELVAGEMQALEEELRAAAEPRRAAWEAQVRGQSRDPAWSSALRALQETVGQELAALRWAWDQGRDPAQPHGLYRLVRSEPGAPAGRGLQAAEVIGALRSKEACLEAALRQLQGQCRRELARLMGALPGFVWISSPVR
ncbi:tubulin epsilon and delta complex protein 1-like isoform X4 [Choloepus didactylus]|uniref:tubulin epsilon and delta complex protein 1-like isoform X4 n=1 Tax=Choloepus didactylus TaxID=27675 RepID=UPI00189CC5C9|nr:tubulin epsilon and delta complex protein 1-like isoform X4 [Choloepus didactylus]